jgi:hypothetical protein
MEVVADALYRHIEELESYGPDDADERIEAANQVLCKIGYQKKIDAGWTKPRIVYSQLKAL